ncbi:MAG: hypothetical protein Fur0023_13620 [Bacteroidia bacterium]
MAPAYTTMLTNAKNWASSSKYIPEMEKKLIMRYNTLLMGLRLNTTIKLNNIAKKESIPNNH